MSTSSFWTLEIQNETLLAAVSVFPQHKLNKTLKKPHKTQRPTLISNYDTILCSVSILHWFQIIYEIITT